MVVVEKQGNTTLTVGAKNIQIGDLAPRETVRGWIWLTSSTWSTAYSDLRVTHDTGVAKMRPKILVDQRTITLQNFAAQAWIFVAALAVVRITRLGLCIGHCQ